MISTMQVDSNHPNNVKLCCPTSLTTSEKPDSRFMIDNQTYLKLHPHAAAFDTHEKERLPFDRRPSYLRSNRDGSADIYCLMAPDTYGFYFTEKKWSKDSQST